MSRILIMDGEQRSALAAARSLGRAGHEVLVASTHRRPLAGASKFCSATFVVHDPRTDPERYRADVEDLVQERSVDLVIPMTDVSAGLLLGIDGNPGRVRIPFPPRPVYEAISDKARLMEVARELGVPVPDQVVVEEPPARSAENIEERMRAAGLDHPVVVKPSRSAVREGRGVVKVGVGVAASAGELSSTLGAYPTSTYPILVQRRINGPGLGVFILRWEGKTLAAFAHRRLRERPPQGGVSVYRESVALRPDLLAHAERLLDAFDWEGVAMVEFKEERSTGVPYLMEVNARFWGSLQLAVDAGVDFPALLADAALGRRVEPVVEYREGIRSRWWWGEVDHLLAVLRAGGQMRRTHRDYPGRIRTVLRFPIAWLPGDRYEVLRLSDPRPFLRESVQWLRALGS